VSTPVRRSHLHDAVLGALGRLPDAPETTGPDGPQPEAGTLRILLAEDNPLNQRAATLMLGRLGHRTDMVGDGERAVAAIHSGDYDLVLMDVQMPGIDGIEATRRARSHPPGRRPRIVAVTASATPEVRQACLDAGMDDVLAKPFSLADLTRVVEATPHRPRPRPAAVGGPDRGAPPASSARTRRVLYVDDNPMLITLVERILAREPDLIVLTADRGEQALALAATAHPDLILFDLNLPDMTGDVLLRRLRADSATRSIPAVVVSGDTDPATIERLITLGAVDYLTKPFDAARLRGTLAAVLHAAEPTAPAAP
jgi:CheY-like chemotaxis protein